MEAPKWTSSIGESGTWLCEHIAFDGTPAPATCLRITNVKVERPESKSNQRSRLYCPDCGTLWRYWPETRTAKYYVQRESPDATKARFASPPRYRRPSYWDIDHIIDGMARAFPELIVTQWQYIWPADHDEIWWFDLPGKNTSLQIDGGMCPIVVETPYVDFDERQKAATIADAVQLISEQILATD